MIKSFYDYSPRFRRRMQQNFLWATLSVLLLVLGLEVSLYRTVRKDVSRERINHLQQQIETPFTLLVERMIKTNLEGIRQMGEQGILDLTDPDTLNKHMLHALSKVPLQGVLQIADEDGGEFLMYETGLAPPTRLVRDSDLDGWTILGWGGSCQ